MIEHLLETEYRNPNLWQFEFNTSASLPQLDRTKFLVQSLPLPFMAFETVTRPIGTKHYESVRWIDEIEVTFLETADLDVLNFHLQWRNSFYDIENKVFKSGVDPRFNGILTFFKFEKGQMISIQTFNFINITYKSFADTQNTYENTNNQIFSATYAVEEVRTPDVTSTGVTSTNLLIV